MSKNNSFVMKNLLIVLSWQLLFKIGCCFHYEFVVSFSASTFLFCEFTRILHLLFKATSIVTKQYRGFFYRS